MSDLPNIAFLDFEASSLGKNSYPIEVAWVFADGEEETYLIRPDPLWTDWDVKAEAIHGISRSALHEKGMPLHDVARRMMSALAGHKLYATAPSWDGKWLSKLLRAAGLPRHALRLEDTDIAHKQVMSGVLQAAGLPQDLHPSIMQDVVAQAQRNDDDLGPAAHRALADARRERRLWLEIRQRAADIAAHLANSTGKPASESSRHRQSTPE
jgi:hypothetical protein